MKQFAQLFLDLENTSATNQKVSLFQNYFAQATDEDKLWALALFSHKRPKSILNTRQLREIVLELTGLEPWLFEESYSVVGDLAETLSLVLPDPADVSDHSLTYWIELLISIKSLDDDQRKAKIKEALNQLDKPERFVFFKLLTGGFRVGMSKTLVLKALGQHLDIDPSTLAHRSMGNWTPESTTLQKLLIDSHENEDLSKPYPFYLAYALETEPQALGPLDDWQVEWKWDGIRSQLIVRDGQLSLWSRGEELITEKFPEFEPLAFVIPSGTVIDGELLPVKEGKPLPFALLQKRIGRKNLTKKILQELPATIRAYDLLEWQGRDIRSEPLQIRRVHLEDLISKLDQPVIQLSEIVSESTWEDFSDLQKQARTYLAEGFMLKKKSSTYQSGRNKGDWWKWKIEPMTVDAVMIYAQKGHGKRADLFSDYTLAVWDEDTLVPFAKAYSGLTDKELAEVSRFVRSNTKEKFGPVRTVTPELVFEVAFEGIQLSPRHKSGVAVRFPRIHRWRKDKKPDQANTLTDLKDLLKQYGAY
ncbi:MAG: ATP-dependent DNA ligase [Cyclobacteriaceae bacterium]